MNILVSNDDGINAAGIHALAKKLTELGQVTVVAPENHQSGMGHAVTFTRDVRVRKTFFEDGIEGYAVDGTPSDCVAFAMNGLLPIKFDLIVSGINQGANLSNCTICSGTCGAASVGLCYSIPAIAVSLDFGDTYQYDKSAEVAYDVAKWFVEQPFKHDFVLSINVPNIPDDQIKGYHVCKKGGTYLFHKKLNFTKKDGCIYVGTQDAVSTIIDRIDDLSGDIYAVENGYIALTPLTIDTTDYANLSTLSTFEKRF